MDLLNFLTSALETVEHTVTTDDEAIRNARTVSVMTIKLTVPIAAADEQKNKPDQRLPNDKLTETTRLMHLQL